MTVTTGSAENEPQGQSGQATEDDSSAGTESRIAVSASGDRCAVCGAELAQDQRYCVECGTRRGAPRFSAGVPSQRAATAAVAAPARRRPSSTTLIAAIATLLIALGVGVLVGHYISKSPTVKVEVTGSGGSSSSGSTGSSSSGSGGSSSSGSSGNSSGGSGAHSGSGSHGSGSGHSGNFFP